MLSTRPLAIIRYVCIALLAFVVMGPVSKADGVNYTFDGSNGSFSYTSDSGFIAPGETLFLYKSDLNTCNGCSMLNIVPSATLASDVPWIGDLIAFGGLGNLDFYAFQSGAFDAYGTYNSYASTWGSGTLTVSGTGSVKTPEPGTIGLLACGLLFMAGFASRKRFAALATARS